MAFEGYSKEELELIANPPVKKNVAFGILEKYGLNPLKEVAGIVEPIMQVGSSFVAEPIADLATLGGIAADLTGYRKADPIAEGNAVREALTYSPRTTAGKFVSSNVLAPVGGFIDKGMSAVGDVAYDLTGSETARSVAKEAATQGVGFIGVKGGASAKASAIASNLKKVEALKQSALDSALKNKIRVEGNKIGLIAPSETGIKHTISNVGKVNPAISNKNMKTATNVLSEEVGLPKGAIRDIDIYDRVNELGKSYTALEQALPPMVNITPEFVNSVNSLLQPMKNMIAQDPKAFVGYKDSIALLEHQLTQQSISPSIMMAKIAKLRSDASVYKKNMSGKPIEADLADASYKLANIYEDLVESTLGGNSDAISKFRDARKQLAKIHVIDSARNNSSGLIELPRLVAEIGKYGTKSKFVDGNLKVVSDFAKQFGDTTKAVSDSQVATPTGYEAIGGLIGLTSAIPTGGKSLALTIPYVAKSLAPSFGKAGMLQNAIPSYGLSSLDKIAPNVKNIGMMTIGASPYYNNSTSYVEDNVKDNMFGSYTKQELQDIANGVTK
jgi:hypothetical protein